jgi:hypothetical protein
MPTYQNVQVQAVQSVTNGYGFNVTDRRRHPLFTVVYANQSAAEDGRDAMIEALDRAFEVVVPLAADQRRALSWAHMRIGYTPATLNAPHRYWSCRNRSGASQPITPPALPTPDMRPPPQSAGWRSEESQTMDIGRTFAGFRVLRTQLVLRSDQKVPKSA